MYEFLAVCLLVTVGGSRAAPTADYKPIVEKLVQNVNNITATEGRSQVPFFSYTTGLFSLVSLDFSLNLGNISELELTSDPKVVSLGFADAYNYDVYLGLKNFRLFIRLAWKLWTFNGTTEFAVLLDKESVHLQGIFIGNGTQCSINLNNIEFVNLGTIDFDFPFPVLKPLTGFIKTVINNPILSIKGLVNDQLSKYRDLIITDTANRQFQTTVCEAYPKD